MVRAVPVVFMAYDILEDGGEDIRTAAARRAPRDRSKRISHRRAGLRAVAEIVSASAGTDLAALAQNSRARGVEGLMLKRPHVGLWRRPAAR